MTSVTTLTTSNITVIQNYWNVCKYVIESFLHNVIQYINTDSLYVFAAWSQINIYLFINSLNFHECKIFNFSVSVEQVRVDIVNTQFNSKGDNLVNINMEVER